jgi:hypothetical protein
MRHEFKTAPRDGTLVILEDGTTRTYDHAHWSAEALAWVRENGESIKIKPSHWHPSRLDSSNNLFSFSGGRWYAAAVVEAETALDKTKHATHTSRRFAVSLFAAVMVATFLIGVYFRSEVADYVTRYAGLRNTLRIGTIPGLVSEQELSGQGQGWKTDSLARDEVLPQQAAADRSLALDQERDITAALVQDAAAARQEQIAFGAQYRQALADERNRSAALASELAIVRRDLETQMARSSKLDDEAAQLNQRQREKAGEQKPAAVEEKPSVSVPAWANNAFVNPAPTERQPDVPPENSKPRIKPVETAPLAKLVEQGPRQRDTSPEAAYGCQRYRSYDPASGTYTSYDGRRHSCP